MSTATSQALHIAQRTQPCLRTSLMHPFCSKHYTSDHRHVPYCSKVHSSPGGNAGLKLGGSTRLSCLSKLPPKYARSQVQACATRGEGDAGPKPSSTTDAEVERGSSSQKQGDQASLQLLRQRMAEVQKEEEEEGEEDYHDFLNSYQDIDFDSLEIDDKLLFEELGLTPEEVEQQRDLSRAGFTDPEGIEFDHDEVSGAEQELPQELKLALLDKSVYGPEAVVLAGFPPEEHGMVRAVLDASGGAIIKALPVTCSEQLHNSVDEMIWSEEQDWSQPRKQDVASEGNLLAGGWGSKRTVLFSGLSVKAQATILELLDNCGLQGVIGCMALEQDGPRRLGDVLAAAVKEEREQQKHHRQKRLQQQQEQQRQALEQQQEKKLRQQQQQQQKAQEAKQPNPFQNSPFSSEAVRSGSLPLPEGWSGRVVDDLSDLGSLEDLIGKQARERMMQELKHDAAAQQQEEEAAAAAAAGAAAQPYTSSKMQDGDEHSSLVDDADDPRTRIIDAVIGPALSTGGRGEKREQGSAPSGAGVEAEVAARMRQREQELARRMQEQEARVAKLQQQQQQQEAEQRRRLEEEQEVLRREVEAMLRQQPQQQQPQQQQQQQQQQPQEAENASQRPSGWSFAAPEQPSSDATSSSSSSSSSSRDNFLGPEGSDIFGGLTDFENTLDDLFAEAAPREGPSSSPPTTVAAPDPPPPAAAGAASAASMSSSSSSSSNFGSGADSSQARDEDLSIFGGLPEFENPLDDLLAEAGPGSGAAQTEAEEQQQQQQMQLLRAQEQRLQQEKQEAQLSEQGLSILELIQRGLREGAPAEELKQLIEAAHAIEQQPPSSPAAPGTPTATPPLPTPPSASAPLAAPTASSLSTSNASAPTGASTQPSTSGDSGMEGSGSSSNSSNGSSGSGLRRVGRTGRGSIFNRAPKGSGSGRGKQSVSSGASAPPPSGSISSGSNGSLPGSVSSTTGSSSVVDKSAAAGSSSSAGAGGAQAAGAAQPRSRLARSWNKAKPKVPYGPPPPPPPPPPEQQGLHTLRPEALRKLEGKNVQFVDLSKLPTKYRRQMADRMREQKEALLLQQLQLQQAQQAQQEAQQRGPEDEGAVQRSSAGQNRQEFEGEEGELEEEEEEEELEGLVGGGSEVGSIVGSVSRTRRGRLAGMLERSLRRKVKVVRMREQEGEEDGDEQEGAQGEQQQKQQGQQRGQREGEEGQQGRGEDTGRRALSGHEVAELVDAAKQQGLDPSRMLAEAMAMGVLITPQAAAAAGMRLPDSRLVAAAKRGIADQLQAAQAGPGDEDGDQDDDEDEDEEEEAGGRAGLSSPRSASAAVYEERQRRMKAEQQAVWRQRARAWRGQDEEHDDDDGDMLNVEDGDKGMVYNRRSGDFKPRFGQGSGVVDVEAEVVEDTQRHTGSSNGETSRVSDGDGVGGSGPEGARSTSSGVSGAGESGSGGKDGGKQRAWGAGWARPRR